MVLVGLVKLLCWLFLVCCKSLCFVGLCWALCIALGLGCLLFFLLFLGCLCVVCFFGVVLLC